MNRNVPFSIVPAVRWFGISSAAGFVNGYDQRVDFALIHARQVAMPRKWSTIDLRVPRG
jgi:hypothetical protein